MKSSARPALRVASLVALSCIAGLASLSSQPGPTPSVRNAAPRARPAPESSRVGPAINENKATPVSRIKAAKDFQVELIYSVPGEQQGSWVNLCVDPKGRIYASDQYGGLYRFTPPPPGQALDSTQIERVPADIRAVNGMVWAFGALYVGVNDYDQKIPCGLYRLTDSDGDDQLDKVELLRAIEARGDHGVHAVLLTEDGKGLYLVCGNGAKLTEISPDSPVPHLWGEDHLLPRIPDGRGFMTNVLGPGGIIYRVTPDGRDFRMVACGFRNVFDAALNREGDLFTFDADMEYDFNTSWYRPTRINHVVSGAEFGWRNGAGKRPEFYEDNLPAVIDIGPGSPAGTVFGYGAKFPARYQNAFFGLDWSWGKLYAVFLEPDGATYKATKEEFLSGTPLPLTDAIIHPGDGAMYFAIGGRRVQSGVYRVTYQGTESTAPAQVKEPKNPLRDLRHRLEKLHTSSSPKGVAMAWPYLGHADRFIRWAARTAIEHIPTSAWADRALRERDPAARVEALLALARAGGISPPHRTDESPPVDHALGERLLKSLVEIDFDRLDPQRRLALVRTAQIILHRFDIHPSALTRPLKAKLEARYPADGPEMNWLLCETLVYLQSESVAEKTMALIAAASTQEEQIEYARSLRMLKKGWTMESRKAYLEWFNKAANFRGGASFKQFIAFIRTDALTTLTEKEKSSLEEVINRPVEERSVIETFGDIFAGRTPRDWKLADLAPAVETGMKNRNFENGRRMFGAAACVACHRFNNQGGMTGPDLTGAGGRYSAHDLLDQILNPSKEINEQFVPIILTKENGETVVGTVVNLKGDTVIINTDPSIPNQQVAVDRKEVKSIEPSKISPMPPMLLSSMTEPEILDLLAYVLSAGNRNNEMFGSQTRTR
ncbi:MAG: c-type cytochrome [Opitutaceae bacterium]|nr:c-type cytochrome [Opitutaceae bacterium]